MQNRPLAHAQQARAATTTIAHCVSHWQAQGLPRIDAQLLLLHTLARPQTDRAWLIAHGDEPLAPAPTAAFNALCTRRLAGEPLAYLSGHKHFYGLDLQVDARVLDPRPDTETLVDWALELLSTRPDTACQSGSRTPHSVRAEPVEALRRAGTEQHGGAQGERFRSEGAESTDKRIGHFATATPRVLDLGTGSGAIALALAHAAPQARVLAVDESEGALAVARANAERLGLAVDCVQSNWFANVQGRFDLIVSNPPYIAEGDPHLPALRHEPQAALVAGADGLRDLRDIIQTAPDHLAPGAWLLLEHGWDQADAVQTLLQGHGFAQVQTRNDLAGVGRCTGGQWPAVK